MPSHRSRDFHQLVPWEASRDTGPGFAAPAPLVVVDGFGGMGGSGLEGACCTRVATRGAGLAAVAGLLEPGSVDGAGGAAGSFQAGAKGCFVLPFWATMWLAVGWPRTARSIESFVAS
jgi:hypothetical protein